MTDEALASVQRRALERALVDDVDARRYFALAGALDVAHTESSRPRAIDSGERVETTPGADGLLPAALLSLAVIPHLVESADDAGNGAESESSSTVGAPPATPPSPLAPAVDPWGPDNDPMQHAVARGARLALRWFDVSADRVAARAGLPRTALGSSDR